MTFLLKIELLTFLYLCDTLDSVTVQTIGWIYKNFFSHIAVVPTEGVKLPLSEV